MRRLFQILSIATALVITDAHWAIMQSITWAEMVASESQVDPAGVSHAIVETVSGVKPCQRCLAIQDERESTGEKQLDLLSKTTLLVPVSRSIIRVPSPPDGQLLQATEQPAPRLAPVRDIDHPPDIC